MRVRFRARVRFRLRDSIRYRLRVSVMVIGSRPGPELALGIVNRVRIGVRVTAG